MQGRGGGGVDVALFCPRLLEERLPRGISVESGDCPATAAASAAARSRSGLGRPVNSFIATDALQRSQGRATLANLEVGNRRTTRSFSFVSLFAAGVRHDFVPIHLIR